jgi:hypothetical protein
MFVSMYVSWIVSICMYVCMYVCKSNGPIMYIFFTDQDPQVYVCM